MERSQDIAGLICSARKDYELLPLSIIQMWRMAPVSIIYVVTEDGDEIEGFDVLSGALPYTRLTDEEALGVEVPETTGGGRRGWFVQQFIKLLNATCAQRWQLTVDADTMLTKPYKPFTGSGKPRWFHNPGAHPIGQQQYRRFNEAMFGFKMEYEYNFVSECCLYDRSMIPEMVKQAGCGDDAEFIQKAVDIINSGGNGVPAESETYMGYVHSKHGGTYELVRSRFLMRGKYEHLGDEPWRFKEVALTALLDEEFGNYDYASFHSWL